MKKYSFIALSLALLLSVTTAKGQITITASDFPSNIGYGCTEVADWNSPMSPGSPGANQTWDLRGLDADDPVDFEVIDRSATPDPGWFPSANWIMGESDDEWMDYTYAELTSSHFKLLGFVNTDPDTTSIQDMINEPPFVVFPMQYGSSWMTRMYYEVSFQEGIAAVTDTIWITVDGWGTVIIDDLGSVECLRLKLRHHSVVTFDGIPMEDFWTWHYQWMAPGYLEVAAMESESGADENFTEGYFWRTSSVSAAEEPLEVFPIAFQLESAYPNPFNPETTIPYSVNRLMNIELIIYNSLGQEVRTLVSGQVIPGNHQVAWNGMDNSGRQVGAGIYYCRLLGSQGIGSSQKLVLIR